MEPEKSQRQPPARRATQAQPFDAITSHEAEDLTSRADTTLEGLLSAAAAESRGELASSTDFCAAVDYDAWRDRTPRCTASTDDRGGIGSDSRKSGPERFI